MQSHPPHAVTNVRLLVAGRFIFSQTIIILKWLLDAEGLTLAYWSNSRAASACRRCSINFPKQQQNKDLTVWWIPRLTCPATCCHSYLPGLWPAALTGRVAEGFAAPHRWHFSNWSCRRKPAGRWLALRIAIATGRPAPPVAAPPGAQHKRSSRPRCQR